MYTKLWKNKMVRRKYKIRNRLANGKGGVRALLERRFHSLCLL
jgi:hypothetical protein